MKVTYDDIETCASAALGNIDALEENNYNVVGTFATVVKYADPRVNIVTWLLQAMFTGTYAQYDPTNQQHIALFGNVVIAALDLLEERMTDKQTTEKLTNVDADVIKGAWSSAWRQGHECGVQCERHAIVAWLRDYCEKYPGQHNCRVSRNIANDIERGAHLDGNNE